MALADGRLRMPALGATGWLNSPPLSPPELRGQVVLVNFWTLTRPPHVQGQAGALEPLVKKTWESGQKFECSRSSGCHASRPRRLTPSVVGPRAARPRSPTVAV